jgi:hypothetical protein
MAATPGSFRVKHVFDNGGKALMAGEIIKFCMTYSLEK